jgi:hypothetical protein
MKVKNITYVSDYRVYIEFDDGVSGEVDLNDIVDKGIFKVLKDKKQFSNVHGVGSIVYWSDELEIDALPIYIELTGKKIEDVLNPKFQHASD